MNYRTFLINTIFFIFFLTPDLWAEKPVVISAEKINGGVEWFRLFASTGQVNSLGQFGVAGSPRSYSHWESLEVQTRAYMYKEGPDSYTLASDSSVPGVSIGNASSLFYPILGKDFDRSGLSDVAFVDSNRRRFSWRITLNPFSDTLKRTRVLFGKSYGKPFSFKARGTRDLLAVYLERGRRKTVTQRGLYSKRKRKIRLRGRNFPSKLSPFSFMGVSGREEIAFRGDEGLYLPDPSTREFRLFPLSQNEVAIPLPISQENGSVIALDQDSLRYENGTQISLSEKIEGQLEQPIVIGAVEIEEQLQLTPISSPTASLSYTATHKSTPLPVSTATAPVLLSTYTPYPTLTLQFTLTMVATYTSVPTYTAASTYTPIPVPTQVFTYTPYPTLTPTLTPTVTSTPYPLMGSIVAMSEGQMEGHHCAVKSDGKIYCWGRGNSGQLGNNTFLSNLVPQEVALIGSGATEVVGGKYGTCAIVSGGVRCWGLNNYGQIGNGNTTNQSQPFAIPSLSSNVTDISSGDFHLCVVQSGSVFCLGYGSSGRLGNNASANSSTPVAVQDLLEGVSNVALGDNFGCALLTPSKGVECWGTNGDGQLGVGDYSNRESATNLSTLTSGVEQIAAGGRFACARMTGGTLKCWGYNGYGQLGDGSFSKSTTPVDVLGITNAIDISAGTDHVCAVLATGTVNCWGRADDGQLGNGQLDSMKTPQEVVGIGNAVSVSLGDAHSCALLSTGEAACWGWNRDGQLGNNTSNTGQSIPVSVLSE